MGCRNRITCLLLSLCALSTSSATQAASENDANHTTVGVSLVLSGPAQYWGAPIRNGLELGARQSLSGIQLQFQDDVCEARRSLANFKKFLTVDGISTIVLGCMESIEATMPLAEASGATVLAVGGMTREYLQRFPNLISLYTLVDTEAYYLIPYLKQRVKARSIAIINHSQTYGEHFGAGLERLAAEAGIPVTHRESVDWSASDFRSVIVRVMRAKPDAVITLASTDKEGLLIRQLRELGYKGLIFGTFAFETEEVKTSGGAALEGVLYTYPALASEGPDYQDFRKLYVERFASNPQTTAAIAYDGIRLLDRALAQCGDKPDRLCIPKYFAGLGTFTGAGGKVIFGNDRSAIRPFGLKQVKDGSFVWIENELPRWEGTSRH